MNVIHFYHVITNMIFFFCLKVAPLSWIFLNDLFFHNNFSASLAEEASKIASAYNDVFTAKILDEEQCKELKMGSYLGVAAASANLPRFIHLCYKPPNGDVKKKLAIVGKGLTFDRYSGLYDIHIIYRSILILKLYFKKR